MEDKNRCTGRSTRLVDDYIQELFKNKKVIVKDHYESGNDMHINNFLADRILRRLALEHTTVKPRKSYRDRETIITI